MTRRVATATISALLLLALALGACSASDPETTGTAGTGPTEPGVTTTRPTAAGTPDPARPGTTPAGPEAGLLTGYLDELVVAPPDPDRPAYDRDTWEEGLDTDGDCLRTRHEVLAEESLVTATIEDCKVVGGSWIDSLSGQRIDDPTALEVDHLVALADAHRSGGWRWDPDRKAAFANELSDPGHLNAVTSAENQRKADAGPESYRPAAEGAWCWYATAYARVKATWELTVTPEQMAGLRALGDTCA